MKKLLTATALTALFAAPMAQADLQKTCMQVRGNANDIMEARQAGFSSKEIINIAGVDNSTKGGRI